MLAVSPFDGVNRIRFKGSPDCRLATADCGLIFRIPKSAFSNPSDSQPQSFADRGSPETYLIFKAEKILEPGNANCKLKYEFSATNKTHRS